MRKEFISEISQNSHSASFAVSAGMYSVDPGQLAHFKEDVVAEEN